MKQWYEELFENSAITYDKQPFVKGTEGEIDFIEKEIEFDKSAAILDIGCGTGRHAIELAKRGYSVTAIDLSASQLAKARKNAEAAKVSVQFERADARYLDYSLQFDVVIMICEGAFPLMETDEMNFDILKNASNALKRNGVFVLTTLNGLFPLFHSVKDFVDGYDDHNKTRGKFDVMTFREYSEYEHVDDHGTKHLLKCNERYYVPPEITWLLKTAGFSDINIYGAELGNWNRNNKLTAEDLEMLVVARKC